MQGALQSLKVVALSRALFFLNAAIWLTFGIASIVRMADTNPDNSITLWVVAIMMFGNVGAMLVSGIGIGRRNLFFYILAMAVILVNIVLTFTDEFGIFDFLTLLIDLVIFALLIVGRKHILPSQAEV